MNNLTSHIVAFATGAIASWYLTSTFYISRIDGIYAAAQKAQIEAVKHNSDVENNLYEQVIKEQSELASSLTEIDNAYSHSIDFFDNDVFDSGVFDNAFASDNSVSEDSKSAAGNSKQCAVKQTKCDCVNTAEFRALYKKQQAVSRDCDIDRQYLKTVVRLYESVQNGY